jgi:beta-lactamase superfamily II metal-dependent hydrolase
MRTHQVAATPRPDSLAYEGKHFLRETISIFLLGIAGLLLPAPAAARSSKALEIYFVDVEGGQATLVVSPLGESVLIDTGWAGTRDAERIQAAANAARIKRINYVLITHYHGDHVGGVADLITRIPVDMFVDHGGNAEDSDAARAQYASYEKAMEHSKRIQLGPNQGLPLKGMRLEVLTTAGEHIAAPLPGASEANPYCDSEAEPQLDTSENAQSLGILIAYDKFRFLDLGDLTKKKELELVCPNNLIGKVDLYLTTHHGMAADNPKALVWALHPRVTIMNNGAHKGGSPEAWQIVHDSPGLSAFWQLHYAADTDQQHNVGDDFIANLDEKSDGHAIKVVAMPDGTFTVTNLRNGVWRRYTP